MKNSFLTASAWIQGITMLIWLLTLINPIIALFFMLFVGASQLILNTIAIKEWRGSQRLKNRSQIYWVGVLLFAPIGWLLYEFTTEMTAFVTMICLGVALAIFSTYMAINEVRE